MTKREPLVTVIIPIYNTKAYLSDCLNSVCNQTLDEIEIICINDGSTDGSEEIVKEYMDRDVRIQMISQKNGGLSSARNLGLSHATGKYVYFLDSDDYIGTEALEVLYMHSIEEGLDILLFGGEPFFEENVKELKDVCEKEKNIWSRKVTTGVISGEALFSTLQKNKIFLSSVCTQFYRREYLVNNNFEFANGFIHEDLIFTYETTLKAAKVQCTDLSLFHRRLRSESIRTTSLSHKNFEGRFHTFIRAIHVSRQHDPGDNSVVEAMIDFIRVSFNNCVHVYKKLTTEEQEKIFMETDPVYKTVYEMLRFDLR